MSREPSESPADQSKPTPTLVKEGEVLRSDAHENQFSDFFSSGDYVSPGLALIKPDSCFPHMTIGDPTLNAWPFLRRELPHNWYVDARHPHMGFLSRDEAHILYNTALKFKGKAALEIGCWMGWSACHLALGGVTLDIVDPVLENPEAHASISQSLQKAGVIDSVKLIPGYSPEKVQEIVDQRACKWSLIFIDGNHEAPYPFKDADLCEQFAEADAAILFHDLASPDVAEGLECLRQKGWNTMIYQTMQIMGVAWRGNIEPVIHQPDPSLSWHLPKHLSFYRSQFSEEIQAKEKALAPFTEEIDRLRTMLKSSQAEGWQLRGSNEWSRTTLEKTISELSQLQGNLTYYQNEFTNTQTQLMQLKGVLAYSQAQLSQAQTDIQHLQVQIYDANATAQRSQTEHTAIKTRLTNKQKNLQRLKQELQESQEQISAMETSKFWKIRKGWVKVKRLFGLKGDG
jgi:predicted O-methyltransferase YrrM